jgi:polyphosphate kinase
MAKQYSDLNSPDLFINRELSWLEFNHRVLEEGSSPDVPLAERLKFLAIVASNLDEFFMVRVAGLIQQKNAGLKRRDPSGLTPVQQLDRIAERVHRMVTDHSSAVDQVMSKLSGHNLRFIRRGDWTQSQRKFVANYFRNELSPLLTPLSVDELDPFPLLPNLQLNVAVLYQATDDRTGIVVIPVPSRINRFVNIPVEKGVGLAPIEDAIADNAAEILGRVRFTGSSVFRLTRDADVAVQEDEADDLLSAIEGAVRARQRRVAVRLEISTGSDPQLLSWLERTQQLTEGDVYEIDGLLDAKALMGVTQMPQLSTLRSPDWEPQIPEDLIGAEDLWQRVQEHDVLLHHPYESFEPVIRMVTEAAQDPEVLAIKQTLYRTSGDSPILSALARAAENGKEVIVLVELKARFDEARNVNWARQLEDAGCHVIYGVAGLKTHAKALLIVKRRQGRIRRFVHLATGNYNDTTARLYTDIGLISADPDLAADVSAFFNILTGRSEIVEWRALTIAPTELRRRFIELIEREIRASSLRNPGLVMAKLNSLEDPHICRALYRASRAGVRIKLNIRGICCLRPGIEGLSDNIEIRSIVDRYLEHSRIFYFRNGGHEEVFISSADWMRRNLDRRLELLTPVRDRNLRQRLVSVLDTFFADNVKARRLKSDGAYERVPTGAQANRAQELLHKRAVEIARTKTANRVSFRPLTGQSGK